MNCATDRVPSADDFAGIPSEPLKFSFPTDEALCAKPSLRRRLARLFGFVHQFGPGPEDLSTLPGWARSDVGIVFSLGDRLRLLVSGRLQLSVTHYIDRPVERMEIATDLRVPAPWERD